MWKALASKWRVFAACLAGLAMLWPAQAAQAGHYDLVRYSGSGQIATTTAQGTTTESISTSWEEGEPGYPDDMPIPWREVMETRVDYYLTETYEFRWVEDTPGETPVPETWTLGWEHYLNYGVTSGMSEAPASVSGFTRATLLTGTPGGDPSYQLAGTVSSTPPGIITEDGDIGESGDRVGWLDYILDGPNPVVVIKHDGNLVAQGPMFGYLGHKRQPPTKPVISITISSPPSGVNWPISSDVPIHVDYTVSSVPAKRGAPR